MEGILLFIWIRRLIASTLKVILFGRRYGYSKSWTVYKSWCWMGLCKFTVVYKNKIIVQCDVPKNPYITRWTLRPEMNFGVHQEVMRFHLCTLQFIPRMEKLKSLLMDLKWLWYDFETGKELWRLSNGEMLQHHSSFVNDLIYLIVHMVNYLQFL